MTSQVEGHSTKFREMVDELVIYADYDPELAEGLRWLDKTEKYGIGLTFYQRVYRCLQQYDANEKATNWIKERKK